VVVEQQQAYRLCSKLAAIRYIRHAAFPRAIIVVRVLQTFCALHICLSPQLADRCKWAGFYGTCRYHYLLALETADQPPGEALGYHCAELAGRSMCSAECQVLSRILC
jgi:hypothetical protein